MELNAGQKVALGRLRKFARGEAREFTLSGQAGTGKSTVLAHFARNAGADLKILYVAPTHKAAGVLERMLREQGFEHVVARTLHSALCMHKPHGSPDFVQAVDWRNTSVLRLYDVMVVDECSMVGSELYDVMVDTSKHFGVKLIYTGDPCQLPPVGEEGHNDGKSLTFNAANHAELTEVMRHEGDILRLASVARKAIGNPMKVQFKSTDNIKRVRDVDAFMRLAAQQKGETKVLAWTNDAVKRVNRYLHRKRFGTDGAPFLPGHLVIASEPTDDWAAQQRFEVIDSTPEPVVTGNENVGTVTGWWTSFRPAPPYYGLDPNETLQAHLLDYKEWKVVDTELRRLSRLAGDLMAAMRQMGKRDPDWGPTNNRRKKAWAQFFELKKAFADLRRTHALTVHGSQGSTFENVYVWQEDIFKSSDVALRGKLVYVAYSRASQKLVVC